MSFHPPIALAATALLTLGGAALIAGARSLGGREAEARLRLIAPAPEKAGPPAASAVLAEAALIRAPAVGIAPAELRTLVRMSARYGVRPDQAPILFTVLRVGLVFGLWAAVFFPVRLLFAHSPAALAVLIATVASVVAWLAPGIALQNATKRHARDVAAGLPEALELLVVCVEAGLSLDDGLDKLTRELGTSQPALTEELILTSADLKILPDRDRALANLAARIDQPCVRSVVASLSQTLRYGTPLAQALRVTASELRNDALMKLEERANRLPTLLSVPMMLCIMPTTFLLVGGPAVLRLLHMFNH